MSIDTLSNEQRIVKLAAQTGNSSKYLSDQLVAKYGTARKSEIMGAIGDTGVPWEKLLNDDLNTTQSLQSYIKSLSGLVAYYPLDETSGNAINQAPDTLGSYDGVVTGATQGATGLVGNAYSFDGNNDQVDTNFDPAYSGANAFSFVVMFRYDAQVQGFPRLLFRGRSAPQTDRQYMIIVSSTDTLAFGRNINGSFIEASKILTDGAWHMAIGVYDGSNSKLFVNTTTAETSSADSRNYPSFTANMFIASGNASSYYTGLVQHVAYFNKTLNSTEVENLMNLSGLV